MSGSIALPPLGEIVQLSAGGCGRGFLRFPQPPEVQHVRCQHEQANFGVGPITATTVESPKVPMPLAVSETTFDDRPAGAENLFHFWSRHLLEVLLHQLFPFQSFDRSAGFRILTALIPQRANLAVDGRATVLRLFQLNISPAACDLLTS